MNPPCTKEGKYIAIESLTICKYLTNNSFLLNNRLRQTTIDRALTVFKRVGKLAEDENDSVAFKAFQGMFKILNEGRCPRLNAMDDLLATPVCHGRAGLHNDHVENDPDYPSILHDIGTRFVRAMAPRMHVLIARGKSLPLPSQYVAIETTGFILRFLLDMGKRIRADEPSRYESPIDWSISYVQSVLLPMLAPNMVTLSNVLFAACNAIWSIGCSKFMRMKRDEWYHQSLKACCVTCCTVAVPRKKKAYLHTWGESVIRRSWSVCMSIQVRLLNVSFPLPAHLPDLKILFLLPSIIRVMSRTTNTPERHAMMQYIVSLVFEKKSSDCKRRGSVPPDRMNGDSTQWGLRDMLEHLFQQTPWLHATTYSLDKCDTHDDTSYFAEIIRYFREELILTFLLCWYQRNHVGFRSEKRISPQSLDDARYFNMLSCVLDALAAQG